MKLFIGLGNPGGKHAGQRHNIGFMAVDAIHRAHHFASWRAKFQAEVAEGTLGGEKVWLIKPHTFMNLSGQAAGEAMRYLKLSPADLWVFHDELDLAPGKLRVKAGGGHAGHNGLRSLIQHVGADFNRVRIGIGHPGRKELVTPYVLHDFAREDRTWLEPLLDAVGREAARLVGGDAAGFTSAVAQAVRPPGGPEPRPDKPAARAAADAAPESHVENTATGNAEGPEPETVLSKLLAKFARR